MGIFILPFSFWFYRFELCHERGTRSRHHTVRQWRYWVTKGKAKYVFIYRIQTVHAIYRFRHELVQSFHFTFITLINHLNNITNCFNFTIVNSVIVILIGKNVKSLQYPQKTTSILQPLLFINKYYIFVWSNHTT